MGKGEIKFACKVYSSAHCVIGSQKKKSDYLLENNYFKLKAIYFLNPVPLYASLSYQANDISI